MILNAGCGPAQQHGWLNVDADTSWRPDLVCDMRRLPFADDTFDGVTSNHALQMLTFHELLPTLEELRRVTKPDHPIRLVLPCLRQQIHHGKQLMNLIPDSDAISAEGKLLVLLSWRGETRSLFGPTWVNELLLRAGWQRVSRLSCGLSAYMHELTRADSRPLESLFIEAVA